MYYCYAKFPIRICGRVIGQFLKRLIYNTEQFIRFSFGNNCRIMMLGLRRLHVIKRDLRCVAKSGDGLCQIAHLSVVSKNDQFMNFSGEKSFSHKDQFVSLAHLKTCDVSRLLNRFGLSLNSKCSISGENLTMVNSIVELEEFVGFDVSSVKFKAFLTCLNAFKIIGVPVCFLDDSSKKEHAPLKDCSKSPSISKEESQSNDTPCVSTTQSNHNRDYTKVQVLKGLEDRVHSASWLSANQIITTSTDKTLRIWNLETIECEQVWDNQEYGSVLATLSDGRIVVAGDKDTYDSCLIHIYDSNTKLCVQTLEGHEDSVTSLHVLEDNTIVSESVDKTIRLWNPDSGECLRKLVCEAWSDVMFAVSKNMIGLLSSDNNTIHIWNGLTGECTEVLKCHPDIVRCLCRLPDGRLVSGASDKLIRIWNVETGMCESTLRSHTNVVTELAVLPDGRLVSASDDKTIRIWNVNTGECVQVIETGHCVFSLLVLKDGRIVCSGGDNGFLHIYG